MRRRKVHRALAVYGAVSWGAIATAPDLLSFLGLPSWVFAVLVSVVAAGLPVVTFVSWSFDLSWRETGPAGSEASEPDPGGASAGGPHPEPSGPDVAPPTRARIRGWALYGGAATIAVVGAIVAWGRDAPPPDGPSILVEPRREPGAPDEEAGQGWRVVQQTLEWLLDVPVVRAAGSTGGTSRRGLEEARRRGFRYLVTTDALPAGDEVTLTVALHAAGSGERLLQGTGGGSGESLEEAAGRLALGVARAVAERERIPLTMRPEVTGATSSPVALAHLLEGQRRFAAADFDGAASALRRAIDTDSAFVPAYYRLAVVERWRWNHAEGHRALEAALARPDVPPRWRRIMEAERVYLRREVAGAIQAYQDVTLHYPELLEGWLGLGEALFHFGGFAGHRPGDGRRALETAIEADSLFAPIQHHLAEMALYRGDGAAARRFVRAMAPEHPTRSAVELALALRLGSEEERRRAWSALDRHDLRTLSLLVAHFAFGPLDRTARATIDSIAGALLRPERSPQDRLRGAQYRLVTAETTGGWRSALERWREVRVREPFDQWIVHAHLAGLPVPEAEGMLEWARGRVAAGEIPDFELPPDHDLRKAFQSVVHAAAEEGDSTEVGSLLDALATAGPADPTDPDPVALPAALRARLALLAGDTTTAIAELGTATARTSEPFVAFYPLATMAPERLLLVRLARATGREPLAERWASSFRHSMSFGDIVYTTWVEELSERPPHLVATLFTPHEEDP